MPKSKISAGVLLYRIKVGVVEVLLVHPGGPFFRRKDEGAWSIPKGEANEGEDLLLAARREFEEETNFVLAGPWARLEPIRQTGGKVVHAWACEGDCDPANLKSNTFSIEWPPKSGRLQEFPEVDRADFFDLAAARRKINPAQTSFLEQLEGLLSQ